MTICEHCGWHLSRCAALLPGSQCCALCTHYGPDTCAWNYPAGSEAFEEAAEGGQS